MLCTIAMLFLLIVCTTWKESGKTSAAEGLLKTETKESVQTVEPSAEADETESRETERGFDAEIGKEIGPLLLEKEDTLKQGVRTALEGEYSYEMTKGDDGSCYYYRNEGKGKNKKIVFYKDNGIRVCETAMKKSFEKKDCYIKSFVKYRDRFFVMLYSASSLNVILATVKIKSGEWGGGYSKEV